MKPVAVVVILKCNLMQFLNLFKPHPSAKKKEGSAKINNCIRLYQGKCDIIKEKYINNYCSSVL